MAWTYNGDPSANDRDWIRFRIGDTISVDPQLTDAEIASLLTDTGNKTRAALDAAKRLKAKYARLVDTSVGDSRSESLSQRRDAYSELVKDLERELATSGSVGAIATGISLSRRNTVRTDTDRIPPIAERDEFSIDADENDSDP